VIVTGGRCLFRWILRLFIPLDSLDKPIPRFWRLTVAVPHSPLAPGEPIPWEIPWKFKRASQSQQPRVLCGGRQLETDQGPAVRQRRPHGQYGSSLGEPDPQGGSPFVSPLPSPRWRSASWCFRQQYRASLRMLLGRGSWHDARAQRLGAVWRGFVDSSAEPIRSDKGRRHAASICVILGMSLLRNLTVSPSCCNTGRQQVMCMIPLFGLQRCKGACAQPSSWNERQPEDQGFRL
jgi:hypothetical protein